MEQHPNHRNEAPSPSRESEQRIEVQLIHHHIAKALREQRPIDHATARAIASQLQGGPETALYVLSLSGAIVEGIGAELDSWRDESTPVEMEPWLDALDEYLDYRDEPSPIAGWHVLWPAPPEQDDNEPDSPEHERPPYGSSALANEGSFGEDVHLDGLPIRPDDKRGGHTGLES